MPVLRALGDFHHVARLQQARGLAPLLIPSRAADADKHLHALVVDVPVVAAARLKRHVAHRHLALRQRRKVALADEILGVSLVWLALGEHRVAHGPPLGELLAIHLGYGLPRPPGLNLAHAGGQHGGY